MTKSETHSAKAFSIQAPAEGFWMLLLFALYGIMALFGRGDFWDYFEAVNLYAIILTFPLVFLVHTYTLLPLLAQKRRWVAYGALVVALQLLLEGLRCAFSEQESARWFGDQNTSWAFILAVILSWLYVSVRDWVVHVGVIERLKSEKLQTELDFLKVQIDPHFLFNTLNSIYALALEENSPKTADSIIQLSSLMRYNLHDSNRERIRIEKEIDYIEKFIALQMLRLNENNEVEVRIETDPKSSAQTEIAPLLLIPFIENVFKYGVSPSKATRMRIHLNVKPDEIELNTENDVVESSSGAGSNGVGLSNVRNRLELLYPGQFVLSARQEGGRYYTHLKIQLHA
jgi:sensor histidine kinase YesM